MGTPAIERIVVGVDGSPNTRAAATWAAALAGPTGASVLAVHALGLLERPDPTAAPVPVESHREEIAARLTGEWVIPLIDAHVAYATALRFGPPVEVLLEEAERFAADVIVVGSRGYGGPAALSLGSTSSQLANLSSRPVLIVPPADRPPARPG